LSKEKGWKLSVLPWRWGIRGKLVATVTLIMLAALFVLGTLTYQKSREMLEKELLGRVRVELEWWIHRSLVHRFEELKGLTAALAGFPETQEMLAANGKDGSLESMKDRYLKVLDEYLGAHPAVVRVSLVRLDGAEVMRFERAGSGESVVFYSGNNWRQQHCFQEGLQLKPGMAVATNLHLTEPSKERGAGSFFCIARPVEIQGVRHGVLIVDADFGAMLENTPGAVWRAQVCLADRNGNVFYQLTPAGGPDSGTGLTATGLEKVEPGLVKLLKNREEYQNFTDEHHLQGFTRVYFDRPHSNRYFTVVYRVPREVLLSGARQVQGIFWVTGAAVFLVALLAVHILARAVAQPILRLAAVADRVAKGDLSADAGPMPRRDEIGNLYQSFNAMIAGLRASKSREEEKKTRLLEAASQAAIDITRNLSVSVILDKLVHSVVKIVNAECACLHLASGDGGTNFFIAGQGTQDCSVLRQVEGKSPAEAVFKTGQVVRLEEAEIVAGPYRPLRPGISAFLGVPIFGEGQVIGALCIGSSGKEITEADEAAIKLLAAHAGVAVANARLHEEAVAMARELERRVEERTRELKEINRELERANRLKIEFLATMSHELRTPLNTIIGFTDVLLHELPDTADKAREYLTDIMESAEHLLALINDVLDLAKIEAGKEELYLEPVAVPNLLRGMAALFREKAAQHRIEVELDVAGAGEWVLDVRKFKQILFNLLSNAFKFTPDGGKVGIEARVEDDMLVITVWDTGIGIEPEDVPRLFKPFEQLDSSLARRYPGTGLGLAMVKKLAELHGGSVSLDSEPGKGSRFTVCFPRPSVK
jgi:signal transduction histidine kinase